MRLVVGFITVLHVLISLVIGVFLLAISIRLVNLTDITIQLNKIYASNNLTIIVGLIGIFLIAMNFLRLRAKKSQKERTIVFKNPDGEVFISLNAIEDLAFKVTSQFSEVKDVKVKVCVKKKGLEILNKLSILSSVNIPEITEKIQVLNKEKLQDMLGLEEPVMIKIHIDKIYHAQKEEGLKREKSFHGDIEYGK